MDCEIAEVEAGVDTTGAGAFEGVVAGGVEAGDADDVAGFVPFC